MSRKLPPHFPMRSFLRIRSALILASVTTLLVTASHAGAQGPEPSAAERSRARRLFDEATELETKREWVLAASKLQEALQIVETPGLRYHLAYCQEGQGLMVEALQNYERAQQMIAGGAKAPDVAELLAPKRDALLARIPKLRVRARPPAVIERVAVDGAPVTSAQSGEPIPLNPGRRRVTVWATGQSSPLEREVVLGEGRESREEFVWPSSAPAPATPAGMAAASPPQPRGPEETAPVTQNSSGSARTVVLIAEASLTAVALGVGIGFWVSSKNAGDDAETLRSNLRATGGSCKKPVPTIFVMSCTALEDATHREEDHADIATGAFITAGVGAVATAATWLLWKPTPSSAALGVNVTPLAKGGALELHGHF
jgi:hypothetical protein